MKPISVPAIVATAGLALLAVACGASLSSTGSGGSPDQGASAGPLAFSRCMRSHSVPDYPDPTSTAGVPKETPQQLGVTDAQYQAATQACGSLLPDGGGTGPTQTELRQEWSGMLNFSHCMRSHGVADWPDPTPYPPSPDRPTYLLPAGLQPAQQIVSTMYRCQRLVPHNSVGGHIDNDSWQRVSLAMVPGS